MSDELKIGFLPLVDACLPILAHEHGFAEEEGLTLVFQRDVSWATVLDRLLYGYVLDFLNMSCCGIDNPFVFNVADVFIFIGAAALILFDTGARKRKMGG